jgi:uncharacterized DUF497 family protein
MYIQSSERWSLAGRYERPSPIAKHGVRFSESLPVFEDDYAITVTDEESDPNDVRFVSIGMGVEGRVLVVAYTYRVATVRIISARLAEPHERVQYEDAR